MVFSRVHLYEVLNIFMSMAFVEISLCLYFLYILYVVYYDGFMKLANHFSRIFQNFMFIFLIIEKKTG